MTKVAPAHREMHATLQAEEDAAAEAREEAVDEHAQLRLLAS